MPRGILLFALLLVACAPRIGATVPATGPVFFAAEPGDVYATVLHLIATAPGLPDSSGWIVSSSDSAAGFVRTDTTVSTPWRFWAPERTETLSVVVAAAAPGGPRS
jgi:hypothetical protein